MDYLRALEIAKKQTHRFTNQPDAWQLDSVELSRLTGDLWYYSFRFKRIEPEHTNDVINLLVSFAGETGTFESSECPPLFEATVTTTD